MINVKRKQESQAGADSIVVAFNAALLKEAEWWMGAQSDFLTTVETMMSGGLRRQREAFDVSNRSVRKICDSRNIIDVAQAQNEWISDCLEWTASQLRAVGDDAAALTRKATQRLGEAVRVLGQESEAFLPPAAPVPMERAAAE